MPRFILLLFILLSNGAFTQEGVLIGTVTSEKAPVEFAYVVSERGKGTITAQDGSFRLEGLEEGLHIITVSYVGYEEKKYEVNVVIGQEISMDFALKQLPLTLDDIVVTGTKTFKRKTESPIIVNVLNSKTLNSVQACNLSEGLSFQPGLRVETDCQTCNYTQLRMNGLAGGYSQILINGRPIFSPLTGLYGLEQLPVNMIDRIEVIRGGGSSLYGSSAIGGTVNVLTKLPSKNYFEVDYNRQIVNGEADDDQIAAAFSLVNGNLNNGVSVFFNNRSREFYDHNDDDYSELPKLRNISLGANFFFQPSSNQKIEFSLSNLNEYRFGGEITSKPAHEASQAEERDHNVWMANLDYQINFNEEKTNLITYYAFQNTDRTHFTGIQPDDTDELAEYLLNPPYGISEVSTHNIGIQLNHKISSFLGGDNVITLGSEYIVDEVFDEIGAYSYIVDQLTKDFGLFLQSDWSINGQLFLLSGVRLSSHNLMDGAVFSPRAAILYKPNIFTQIRLGYGEGFRAPQAFDADLHIAFAGGGVSRVTLSPDLEPELSRSLNASFNYDRPTDSYVFGFTLEGFYTRLRQAFILNPIGEDQFGEVFLKENGQGSTVKGVTLEGRANYNRKLQIESGFTFQNSTFSEPIEYIQGVAPLREFIRTPDSYGFANLSVTPNERLSSNVNYVLTGSMKVPHFAGSPSQDFDEITTTSAFHNLSAKIGYKFPLLKMKSTMELYGGVKNITNSYQDDFDIGKNRDSNYIYGPAQPRTVYFGLKISAL